MEAILTEQGFQMSGCTTEECAVKIGKILNVQAVITGICGKLVNRYVLTINIVNVESGKIIYSDRESCYSARAIEDMVSRLAVRVIKAAN